MKTLGSTFLRRFLLVAILAVPSLAFALTLVNNSDGLDLEYYITETSTEPSHFTCVAWSGAGTNEVTVWEDYLTSAKQDWVLDKLTHGWEEA